MLRSSTFWAGVVTGVVSIYAYHMWQAKKMTKGS